MDVQLNIDLHHYVLILLQSNYSRMFSFDLFTYYTCKVIFHACIWVGPP